MFKGFTDLLAFCVVFALIMWLGGLIIEDTIETWASFSRGHPVDVPLLPCSVAAIFVGWNIAIPVWLITIILVPLL